MSRDCVFIFAKICLEIRNLKRCWTSLRCWRKATAIRRKYASAVCKIWFHPLASVTYMFRRLISACIKDNSLQETRDWSYKILNLIFIFSNFSTGDINILYICDNIFSLFSIIWYTYISYDNIIYITYI